MGTEYTTQSEAERSRAAQGGNASRSLVFSCCIMSIVVALGDAAAVSVSGLIAYLVYPGWNSEEYSLYLAALAINSLLTLATFHAQHLYTIDAVYRPRRQFYKILFICLMLWFVLAGIAFSFKVSGYFSRFWSVAWLVSLPLAICLARAVAYFVFDYCVRKGWFAQNVVIVGGEAHGRRLIKHLKSQKEPWMQIIGVFDDRRSRIPKRVGGYAVLGTLRELIHYAQVNRVDDVLVALPWSADERVVDIVRTLSLLPVSIRLCPDAVAFNFLNQGSSNYAGVAALNVLEIPIAGWGALVKGIMDRLLTLLILIPALPLIVVIALLIKLDSAGPVFFQQQRYGFNQGLIKVFKFRSMHVDQQDDNAARLVTRNDTRLTRIGLFLRRTSLDELPQLFNVLKGEMSLVGPRPHALQAKAADMLYQDVVDEYAVRHKVKPGITGWAQVNGWRGETDTSEKIQKRVEHDLYYIEHWSPIFDLYILLLTLVAIIKDKNAY